MASIKETRNINGYDLRVLCIAEQWYTNGTNEEYSELFRIANGADITNTATLYEIAKNIYEHSECRYSNENEAIENIMYCIGQKTPSAFEIIG